MSLQFFRLVCFKLVFSYKIISNARFWQSRTLKTQKFLVNFMVIPYSVYSYLTFRQFQKQSVSCVLTGLSGKINSFSEKKIGKSYTFQDTVWKPFTLKSLATLLFANNRLNHLFNIIYFFLHNLIRLILLFIKHEKFEQNTE